MDLFTTHPRLDYLFEQGKATLANDYVAYRNHCYRVFNCAALMSSADRVMLDKLAIAIYFHDIGIWTDHTLDYLEPSAKRACDYLSEEGLDEWGDEISAMIIEHHKVSMTCGQGNLVESLRRADWIDVSMGLLRFGLPRDVLKQLREAFPNQGFHKRLVQLTMQRMSKHPLSPLPMFKW